MIRYANTFVMLLAGAIFALDAGALESEPFFKGSYLDLKHDMAQAYQEGRGLMVIYEQEGCSYCALMHKVNFADKETVDIMTRHFDVIQLDIWGARELTDFSGNVVTEKQFARNLNIQLSPMVNFFGPDGKEVFRMAGYYKPQLFKTALRYVAEGAYQQTSFREYVRKYAQESGGSGLIDTPIFSQATDLHLAMAAAREKKKGIALLFEQEQCVSCVEMHAKIFTDKRAVDKLTKAFDVMRVNLWGSRALKDFDGSATTEAGLGQSLAVSSTPTIIFFDPESKEVFRYDSYRKPEDFLVLLTYLTTDARLKYPSFQDWLRVEYIPHEH